MMVVSNKIEAQSDSSKIFRKAKGTLAFPISNVSKIETYEQAINKIWEEQPIKRTTFISDSICDAEAIFGGVVLTVKEIDSSYVLITKFGDYFITYFGLLKPNLFKGDFIKKGQFLSAVQKDFDNKYRLEIYLSTPKEDIDPFPWFTK